MAEVMESFMRKCIYIFMFLLIALSTLALFSSCKTSNTIYVDEKNSYFSDFMVENNEVFIKCYITLVNKFDVEKTVNLSAKLPEDVAIGLLKNEEIKALNDDGSEMDFTLPPNSSKSFDVVFVGDFAGTYLKYDRLLPEISINIVG